jgi:hypothetical protein
MILQSNFLQVLDFRDLVKLDMCGTTIVKQGSSGKQWEHVAGDRTFLFGSIPFQTFQGASSLVELVLCRNRLSGVVPASIYGLTQLKVLDLSSNLFESLGEFPDNFPLKSKLEILRLQYNLYPTKHVQAVMNRFLRDVYGGDAAEYESIFREIASTEQDGLEAFNTCISNYRMQRMRVTSHIFNTARPLQQEWILESLLSEAGDLSSGWETKLRNVIAALVTSGVVDVNSFQLECSLKKRRRALDKMVMTYEGDAWQMLDFLRFRIISKCMKSLHIVADVLFKDEGLNIVRVKNRYGRVQCESSLDIKGTNHKGEIHLQGFCNAIINAKLGTSQHIVEIELQHLYMHRTQLKCHEKVDTQRRWNGLQRYHKFREIQDQFLAYTSSRLEMRRPEKQCF